VFKNDYLIRAIEQMGAVLRKAMALEQAREYQAAHGEIDTAMKLLGVPRILTRSMPAAELMRMVRMGGGSDERCLTLSRLIGADAHIYGSEGSPDVAHNLYTTELSVLTALQKDAQQDNREQIEKEIEAVRLAITENVRDDTDLGG
jgi:hypothetical protein